MFIVGIIWVLEYISFMFLGTSLAIGAPLMVVFSFGLMAVICFVGMVTAMYIGE